METVVALSSPYELPYGSHENHFIKKVQLFFLKRHIFYSLLQYTLIKPIS